MMKLQYFLILLFLPSLLFVGCAKKEGKRDTSSLYTIPSYNRAFHDMNKVQLKSARKIGIQPIQGREAAKKMVGVHQLEEVETNELYQVDNLTHSIPFLVPKAKQALDKVAEDFVDSLTHKNLSPYTLIVTSVLRTKDDVKKLRRRNRNASLNSTHCYATTFDIAYTRFRKTDDSSLFGSSSPKETPALLKTVLAEVLLNLKKEKKVYVRYEVKQGCFHITAR